jgi:membrane-associated phospholipid phosphatase
MSIMHLLTKLIADGLVVPIVLVGGIAMLRLPKPTRYEGIARAIATGLIALFFAGVISLFYQDGQRPFEQLGVAPGAAYLNNPGFPSDHALFVFTITFVVWASTKKVALSLVLFAMSVLVAVGRVIALVHTPADVLGGLACACAAALCMYGSSLFKLHTTK